MRVLSFSDIRAVVPYFMHMNEIEMLHPDHDIQMSIVLDAMGFDTNDGIEYIPTKHRNLQGNVVIGFRAVGHVNPYNREFLNSRLADNYDRMAAAGRAGDKSLARELAKLMGVGSGCTMIADDADADVELEDMSKRQQEMAYIEPDYEDVSNQLRTLRWIRDDIRGDVYAEDGSVKPLCSC